MRRIFLWVFLVLCSQVAFAEDGEGHRILVEADLRTSGFGDYSAKMEMVLRNRQKQESHRLMRSRVLEVPGDGDKSLTVFDSPGDVRGTAMLTFSHKQDDDDQWLYLPAIKRVKRISSSNKSGSFMGSEFAYEDLGSREVEKYTSKFVRNETVDGFVCYVVELLPKDTKNSGYSRILSWLDQEEYRVRKEEYYDKRNRLLKTLSLKDFRLYIDSIWKPHRMQMVNHQKGRETDLLLSDYEFGKGYTARDFEKNSLKRMR